MIRFRMLAFAGVSLVALSNSAFAQQGPSEEAASSSEIIVEARRRDESVQDVPLVVNAVTSQTLDKLNIRDLKDISSVVPGLTLTPNSNGIGSVATLRGINFDVNSSGNNGTVEFYLNDEPVSSNVVLQSMFDIGQIEVLRGPQGTLRGRASPSGSITVTTRKPDLDQFGGYVNGTATTLGSYNTQGALNVPIIKGVLALRVAGLFENSENSRVRSLNSTVQPFVRTRSERVTLRFTPSGNFEVIGTYQHFVSNSKFFNQVESANLADSTQPASPVTIGPRDRAAVQQAPGVNRTAFDIFNLRAEWRFAGQKLNYVFADANTQLWGAGVNDVGNFFSGAYPGNASDANAPFDTLFGTAPNVRNAAQSTRTTSNQQSHELRLSSDERLFGMLDYVVGGLLNKADSPFNLWSQTPVFFGAPSPFTPQIWANSNIRQTGGTKERSVFGNLTAHISEATEISGGIRYINYKGNTTKTIQTGTTAYPAFFIPASVGAVAPLIANAPPPENLSATIYSASIKHRFNDNLMIYASTGSSWRASAQTNGIIDGISGQDRFPWGNLSSVLRLAPEKSTSYEIGFKSDWIDRRLQFNLTAYHQDFSNYFYSAPGIRAAQRSALGPAGSTTGPNVGDTYAFATLSPLAVGVPVKVDGVEGELAFQVTPNWNMSSTFSYSVSKIKNAPVPCNLAAAAPFFGTNAAAFVAANGNQQFALCLANFRAGNSSPFSASAQSEYSHMISDDIKGFVRGLVTFNGASLNDPTNAFDDIKAYGLVNLYLGLRGENGNWELTGFAKNLFNTQRLLSRGSNPLSTSYQVGASGGAGITTYRQITMTPEREFGVNLRISFGSR